MVKFYLSVLKACLIFITFINIHVCLGANYGFSVFNTLKYPATFTHYDFVNPHAPQGGTLNMGVIGTFDSLNPYIIKGDPASSISTLTTAKLLDECWDEAGTSYAYGAQSIEIAPDKLSVTFNLHPDARFNNGTPITADDVIWTFETLREKGLPLYRTYYANIIKVEKRSDHQITFHFNTATNNELPLILGQLPLLSKKFYTSILKFEAANLTPPPSSGPYEIESIDPGRSIVYRRVKNWWGSKIPSQRGFYNFERIRIDYYLDSNTQFEAFKAGKIDVRDEKVSKNWAIGYDFPAMKKGWVKREELTHSMCTGTLGFFMNLRRPLFQDIRLRQALIKAFNFGWINKNLFYSAYKRSLSYYPNCDFAAQGVPSLPEIELLKPFADQVPPEVLTTGFNLPYIEKEEEFRTLLLEIKNELTLAGWEIGDQGKLMRQGQPFTFELLLGNRSYEKLGLFYVKTLERLGIEVKLRMVDQTTYQQRVTQLDYDMIFDGIPQGQNLGNEQRDFFGSEKAHEPGTFNFSGIQNPVVDALIEKVINAATYEELVTCSRALDRVLCWNFYMIPGWTIPTTKIAYWHKFGRPQRTAKYMPFLPLTWWYDEKAAQELQHSPKNAKQETSSSMGSWIKRLFS